MQIIPVVDLLDGVVVHAKKGERDSYRPISSKLSHDCTPSAVISKLLSLFSFETIYLADLNAIIGRGDNSAIIGDVLDKFPIQQFWIDSGLNTHEVFLPQQIYIPVIGSESINTETISRLTSLPYKFILSLDFLSNHRLGCDEIFEDSTLWPEMIIIMSLSHVGSGSGADLERLKYYQSRWPQKRFIAAGGIRHLEDIRSLQTIGIEAALVASSLHSGELSANDLVTVHGGKGFGARGQRSKSGFFHL